MSTVVFYVIILTLFGQIFRDLVTFPHILYNIFRVFARAVTKLCQKLFKICID